MSKSHAEEPDLYRHCGAESNYHASSSGKVLFCFVLFHICQCSSRSRQVISVGEETAEQVISTEVLEKYGDFTQCMYSKI